MKPPLEARGPRKCLHFWGDTRGGGAACRDGGDLFEGVFCLSPQSPTAPAPLATRGAYNSNSRSINKVLLRFYRYSRGPSGTPVPTILVFTRLKEGNFDAK